MQKLIKQIWTSKDIASATLLAAIIGVALWIMALPLSTSVQETYLNRFHLATPSFASWAVQQPVPAMYNLENRFWFNRTPLTQDELERVASGKIETTETDQADPCAAAQTEAINHFPTRTFTFAYARRHLHDDPSGYVYLRTRYRDREIRSRYHVESDSNSDLVIKRMESTID